MTYLVFLKGGEEGGGLGEDCTHVDSHLNKGVRKYLGMSHVRASFLVGGLSEAFNSRSGKLLAIGGVW